MTLEFSVEDNHYVLSRFLDRDGNHSAKLAMADDPTEPVARGIQGVAAALFGILGFEYEEFVESFYLAQREITTPHPHSQAVKIMAGVAPLEKVVAGLEGEIAERQELLGEIRAEWDSVDQDVKALGIQEGRMVKLEDVRHQTSEQLEQVHTLADEIDAGLDTYASNTSLISRARGAKGRAGFLRFIVLVLAVAAAALWALLTYGSDLPQAAMARDTLAQHVPQWDESRNIWIAYLAAGLGVLFLLLWIRIGGLKRRIVKLREESRQLGIALGQAREVDIEHVVEETEPEDAESEAELSDDEDNGEVEMIGPHTCAARDQRSTGLCETCSIRARPRCPWPRNTVNASWPGWGMSASNCLPRWLIWTWRSKKNRPVCRRHFNLSDVLNGLTDKREEIEERIADRRRGLELLAGAVTHLSNNFNRDVKDLVGRLLPLFTDGSYEHLQIDDDLKVRVFSSAKRDFMDLEEVSSGTQRQIMLALRLALSKKLLSRTVKGKQFAFLDEPFAFFDDGRTRKALHALTDIGDDISQVWIVAQDFPDNCDVKFDTMINCDPGSNILKVGA